MERVKVFLLTMLVGFILAVFGPHVLAADKQISGKPSISEYLGEKGRQYIEGLEDLTKTYAPQAVEAGLTVIKIEGYQKIGLGLFSMFFLWIPVVLMGKATQPHRAKAHSDAAWLVYLLTWGGCGFFWVCGLFSLLNIWNWVAIIEPKLWIAHRVFEKFI